jgi:hypothetical protein
MKSNILTPKGFDIRPETTEELNYLHKHVQEKEITAKLVIYPTGYAVIRVRLETPPIETIPMLMNDIDDKELEPIIIKVKPEYIITTEEYVETDKCAVYWVNGYYVVRCDDKYRMLTEKEQLSLVERSNAYDSRIGYIMREELDNA